MSNKMKLIMENWRKLQEAAPTSAHHIVRRMKDTGDDALTALMHLIPELPREEASNWLKNNAQDINRAKRELGVTDNDRLNIKLNEATSVHPSVARKRWKEKQAAEKAAQKSQPKADVPGDALRPAAGPASRRASERKGKLGVGKKTWWESKGEPGYAEAWERIAAGDEALAKEVADLVWENGGGLRMHPHAVELDNKAKRLGGQMLSQQTGIEIDAWFSPVLPDDRPPGDERALEWKDFIDYELAKHLYYLHKQHGPDLPYNVGKWDEEAETGGVGEDDITVTEMDDIMETWRALKEAPIWPQGHGSAGREVHPSTMDAYRKYMKDHPKAKPPIKKNIEPPERSMGGKGIPYRRKGGEDDDPTRYIDEDMIEAAIDEELDEGRLEQGIAALGMMLGLAGSPDAQADPGAATAGGEPTTQQVQAEYNAYDVLLGMADTYISGKSMDKKQDLLMDWAKVMSALDKASDGDTSAIDGLTGHDAEILKVLEQHVEKNAGDKELIDHWGQHGAGVQISTHGNLEEAGT